MTLDPALLAQAVVLVGLIGGAIKIYKDLREESRKREADTRTREDAARQSEGRFKTFEVRLDLLWEIFREDAKQALRRTGAVQSQSPDRLSPAAASHLIANGFGARLLAFYRDLRARQPDVTEADGTWQLYVAFKPDLRSAMMTPLDMNVSEALVAAWQFCVDGGADG
jgi:hypothetical protein